MAGAGDAAAADGGGEAVASGAGDAAGSAAAALDEARTFFRFEFTGSANGRLFMWFLLAGRDKVSPPYKLS